MQTFRWWDWCNPLWLRAYGFYVFRVSWHLTLLIFSAVFEVMMLLAVRGRLRNGTGGPFALVLLLNVLWVCNYAFDLASDSLEEKLLLLQLRSTFLPFYVVAWFETAYRFAVGRPGLRGGVLAAALVVPLGTVIVAWVPDLMPLAYHSFRVETHGAIAVLRSTSGPWTHVYNFYNYAVGLAALYFVFRSRLHGQKERWWRTVFVAGSLLGIVADALYEFGLSPTPGLNYAPFILPITSGLIALALLGHRFADLAPVARASLVEQLDQWLLVFDRAGTLIDLNRAAAEGLGEPAARLLGRDLDGVLHRWPAAREILRRTRAGERCEVRLGERTCEAAVLPIEAGDTALVHGRIVSLTDISARKTIELRLREAKEAAEAAEAAQSRFLAMMSHEVRTPMNGMLGFAQILADTPLTPEQRDFVDQIDRNGRSLLVILNDILDFSKITAGQLSVEHVACDVGALAANTCRLFEHQARAKDLVLDCRVPADFPASVAADPIRIGQMLANLVGNALKFTQRGGVTVEVAFVPPPDGPAVTIQVHDTGPGIAFEEQDRIFQPFEQADASTTRKFGGTGLGLTITRSLCELMGGSLVVSSEPGQGSTFTATIRVGLPAAPAPTAPPRAPFAPVAPMHALVFEDNLVNQRVIQALLEKQGHRVHLAGDGAQGLAVLAENAEGFDVILMDIEMPVMDGFEAVRRIRASERPGDRSRHIIALTAHAMAGERERALAAGCDDFLTKPVRAEDLHAALARVPRPARTRA